jgi:proton-dependent oligopeptide transporter, POT family
MMGAYFVAVGISQYVASVVANYASIPDNITDPLESLAIYTSLFNKLGFLAVGGTALAFVLLPLMKRLSASHSDGQAGQSAAAALRAVTVEE